MTQQGSSTPFDFSAFITDRTKDFTGREWIFAEIDRWLADPDGPSFFIITGEPGVGKSAIAARLTQVRELAAYHFCIARQSDTIDPFVFARSLSMQLCRIDSFALGILKSGNITIGSTQDVQTNYGQVIGLQINNLVINAPSAAQAVTHAVTLPLKALYVGGYDRHLVILVDSLDEAIQHTIQHKGVESIVDLLANIGDLPRQVRFVFTSRPENAVLRHFEQRKIPHSRLDAGRSENLADVERYVLAQVTASVALQARLADQRISWKTFAERVTIASQGNFLYLVWLLPAIAAGTQRFDALDALPIGLDGIYRDFLLTRGVDPKNERWRQFYRPLFAVLTVARTPLSLKQLTSFSGLHTQDVIDCVADLMQFLDPIEDVETRYQLYHQSVADFLSDARRAQDFQIDLLPYHEQIVAHYKGKAETWNDMRWEQVDDYGLRHLATHLQQLDSDVKFRLELYELICKSFMQEKYQRYQSHQPFAADVEIALRVLASDPSPDLTLLVRLSLIQATIISQATGISPNVIAAFAWIGQVDKALGLAKLQLDKNRQYTSYLQIGEALLFNKQTNKVTEVLEQAERLVAESGNKYERDQVQTLLVRAWTQSHDLDAALAKLAISDASQRLVIFDEILSFVLKPEEFPKVVAAIEKLGDQDNHSSLSANMARLINARFQQDGTLAALTVAEEILDGAVRDQALSRTVDILSERGALAEAQVIAERIEDDTNKASALDKIVHELIQKGKVDDALVIGRKIPESRSRSTALSQVVSALAQSDRLTEAFTLVQEIDHQYIRQSTLAELLLVVFHSRGFEAGTAQLAALDKDVRGEVLRAVVQGLAKQGSATDALALVERAGDEEAQRNAEMDIATALAETARYAEALLLGEQIKEDWQRDHALGQISEAMIKSGDIDWALVTAEKINEHSKKAHVWTLAAQKMDENGDRQKAQSLLEQAWQVSQAIPDESKKFIAYLELATICMQNATDSFAEKIAQQTLASSKTIVPALRQFFLPELITLLFQLGDIEQAQSLAHLIDNDERKAEVLSHNALAFARAGRKDAIAVTVNNTLELLQNENMSSLTEVLDRLLQALIYSGAFERAVALIKEHPIGYYSDHGLGDLLAQMIQEGRSEEVLTTVNQIADEEYQKADLWGQILGKLAVQHSLDYILPISQWIPQLQEQSLVLEKVVEWLAKHSKVQDALKVASEIKDDYQRSRAISQVLHSLIQNEIAPALKFSQTIIPPQIREEALEHLVGYLADEGKFDLAWEVIHVIESQSRKEAALDRMAHALARRGETAQVRKVVAQITKEEIKDRALQVAAIDLIEIGKLEDGLSIAKAIRQAEPRSSALGLAVRALVKTNEVERAHALADELSKLTDGVANIDERENDLFYELVMAMLYVGDDEGARLVAMAMQGPTWHPTRALCTVADTFIAANRGTTAIELLNQALTTLPKIENKKDRAWMMGWIAPTLFELKRQAGLTDLLHIDQEFTALPLVRADALSRIGAELIDGDWRLTRRSRPLSAPLAWLNKIMLFPAQLRWHTTAHKVLMQALDSLAKIENDQGTAEVLSRIASTFVCTKRNKQAMRIALRALEVAESNQQVPEMADSLGAMTWVFARTQQKLDASELIKRVLAVATHIQDDDEKIRTFQEIAISLVKCGAIEQLDPIVTALMTCQNIQLMTYALTAISQELANNTYLSEALDVVQKAIQLVRLTPDQHLHKYLLPVIVDALLRIDEQASIADTLTLVEAIQDDQERVQTLSEIAQCFVKANRLCEAIELANKDLVLNEHIQHWEYKAQVFGQVAYTMAQAYQYEAGSKVLQQALRTAGQSGRTSMFEVLKSAVTPRIESNAESELWYPHQVLRSLFETMQEVNSWWRA